MSSAPRLFEELDFRRTPMGDLILRRRVVPALDHREVHEVILGDAFLMSSLQTEVETALATLGLAELEDRDDLSVVVGGLGLGYTAAAALVDPRVASLLVVEAMDAVIDWHRRELVPLGRQLSTDPRCRLVHGDFFALAANPQQGFDLDQPGRRFDAVLLDVDHSPTKWLHPSHAAFYQPRGMARLARQLTAGGVFGLWSDDPPDAVYLDVLGQVFADVRAEVVRFDNPLQDRPAASTVYLASSPAFDDNQLAGAQGEPAGG